MEFGGEQSLNDLIEKRREDGLKAFPAANIEKVALHVARGLQVNHTSGAVLNPVFGVGVDTSCLIIMHQISWQVIF